MKIKSIIDVITNSSSEVFIIKRNKSGKIISDPIKMIENLCKALGIKANKIMTWEVAKKEGLAEDGWPGTKCKKGDLIIRSVEENSIPYPIMEVIECLDMFDKSIHSVYREHLG